MSDPAYLLYHALATPCGIAVETPAPQALAAALRAFIRRKQDPALAAISLRREPVPPHTALWIINRNHYANEQLSLYNQRNAANRTDDEASGEGGDRGSEG